MHSGRQATRKKNAYSVIPIYFISFLGEGGGCSSYIYIYIIRRDKVALDSRSLLLGEICYSNAYNKFFVVVI